MCKTTDFQGRYDVVVWGLCVTVCGSTTVTDCCIGYCRLGEILRKRERRDGGHAVSGGRAAAPPPRFGVHGGHYRRYTPSQSVDTGGRGGFTRVTRVSRYPASTPTLYPQCTKFKNRVLGHGCWHLRTTKQGTPWHGMVVGSAHATANAPIVSTCRDIPTQSSHFFLR